jgi:FkbM family methyltransferase
VLTTRRKLQIARLASAGLCGARRLLGLPQQLEATRDGIRWTLDLAEGIDLAIYLGVYQRIGRHVRQSLAGQELVALDIGANIGAFTLPLARLVGPGGKVVAIEATDFAFAKLQRNVAQNPGLAPRILCRQAVLVADDGAARPDAIFASWRLDASDAPKHPSHGGIAVATGGATVQTLDRLLAADAELRPLVARIGFVKLDVDGNELSVLHGARAFLSARRPLLLIEMAPYVQNEVDGRLQALLSELRGLGYSLESAKSGSALAYDPQGLARQIPEGAGIDVLCRPMATA